MDFTPPTTILSQQIKDYACQHLGFDVCGFCKAEPIGDIEKNHIESWLKKEYNADMGYMDNYLEKRCDPTLLVEGARSIISLALNYYPKEKQRDDVPQFAYYAYGKD